ncbi:MAG: DUF11 domain-containing protein [Candidatus Omnitrophica bacterium]|nr:DUF11 domain-containing protein [Candidatus Omnitrophota bacterium]
MANVFFVAGVFFLVVFAAWGSGISVPPNSQLNVNSGELKVQTGNYPGHVSNAGTVKTTTGKIKLNGNWIMTGSGTYVRGTGTVDFTAAAGTQYITAGFVAGDEFFNLDHTGAGTVELLGHDINIDGSFNNLAGKFITNDFDMAVTGNWNNVSTTVPSFVPGLGAVSLNGVNQKIYGSTTFYNLSKELLVPGNDTLTFPTGNGEEQRITHILTLKGHNDTDNLLLRSNIDGTYALLTLVSGGAQDIRAVDVKDSDANNGLKLVARGPTAFDSGHNRNWEFTAVTVRWDGSDDNDWNNPFNWDLGLVPGAGDTAVVRSVDEDNGNAPIVRQPVLTATSPVTGLAVTAHVGNLKIDAGATLTLNQQDILIDTSFIHNGNVILNGMETVTTTGLTDNGTFTYYGMQNGYVRAVITRNIIKAGSYLTTFHNLVINEQNTTSQVDDFTTDSSMTITNDMTLAQGHFTIGSAYTFNVGRDLSATGGTFAITGGISVANDLSVAGSQVNVLGAAALLKSTQDLLVTSGTLNAQFGNIRAVNVNMTGGTLLAPGAGLSFAVSGDFTHPGGLFTANNGELTLDGTSLTVPVNQTLSGITQFYDLKKVVPVGTDQVHTLTFTANQTQTISHYLTLTGVDDTHLLLLRSTSSGNPGKLLLGNNGGQTIAYVDVQDSTAAGLTLVARLSPDHSGAGFHNTNWMFGTASIKWDGSQSTDWADQYNWDLGVVPVPNDHVIIRTVDENNGNAAIPRQPVLTSPASVGSLTLRETATRLDLNGFALTVQDTISAPGYLSNNGTIYLRGTEDVTIATPDIDSGTFVYQGDSTVPVINFTAGTRPGIFYNLVINDTNASSSNFVLSKDMTIHGVFTVDGGTLTSGANSIDLTGNFVLKSGTFVAPAAGNLFLIAGDFTHSGGVFTHNNGTVVLNATSLAAQTDQLISGGTTFYALVKQISAGNQVHRLIFDHTAIQDIAGRLTLQGLSGGTPNYLVILSDLANSPARLKLEVGGLQTITDVDVTDSNAAGGVSLVARSSLDHSGAGFHNTNWIFGTPTVTWDGSASSDWGDPNNWDLGFVPQSGDVVKIQLTDPLSLPPFQTIVNQPVLSALSGAVTISDFTLEPGTSLTLNGYGLTVSGSFSNLGDVIAKGDETVAISNPDTLHGTFTYLGNNTGTVPVNFNTTQPYAFYHDLVFADSGVVDGFIAQTNMHVFGNLTLLNSGSLNISSNGDTLKVDGNMLISSGTSIEAMNGNIDLQGSINIKGTLLAPKAGQSFTVGGNWTLDPAGIFTARTGRVTLDTNTAVTMTGNTSFYEFFINEPNGKTVTFQAGSTQSFVHQMDLSGGAGGLLNLRSSADGSPWTVNMLYISSSAVTMEHATYVSVKDSIATGPDPRTNYILAINSEGLPLNDVSANPGWSFSSLFLIAPVTSRNVDRQPVVIGQSVPSLKVSINDKNGVPLSFLVSGNPTTELTADSNGYFRAKVAVPLPDGAGERLTPVYESTPGISSDVTVEASPTTSEVPVIELPDITKPLTGPLPTIEGHAKPNTMVYVVANNTRQVGGSDILELTLPLTSSAGTAESDGNGYFKVPVTREMARGVNHVSVVADGVSSPIIDYQLNDIYGVVFDSATNNPIKKAKVKLYKLDGTGKRIDVVRPTDIPASETEQPNPVETDDTGTYAFHVTNQDTTVAFVLDVQNYGYSFPTKITDDTQFKAFHRSIVAGSRGGPIKLIDAASQVDLPVDGTPFLFRIEKTANKAEARIGEVVTYSVSIESLSDQDILNARLNDIIPPGFKFMNGRVQLDGVPIADPTGKRPVMFNAGSFTSQLKKKTMRYQLVIGAGVAPGDYENTAFMRYDNGTVISNLSHATVKVVMDPLFDAGTIFGKVFYDYNENGRQDAPDYIYEDRQQVIEGPVPNVHLVMEDGTSITTDKDGLFHVPGLVPGRHLLRLDERSLPKGAYLTTDKVQVVDATPGMVFKVNFGINIDNTQVVGQDVRFFEQNLKIDQKPDQLKPLLNVDMFDKFILMHNDTVIKPVEMRIFMNYAPFITSWRLDIVDKDTKHLVKEFAGTRYNINDPVVWDGRDSSRRYVRSDRNYTYVLKVEDDKGAWDETKEKPLVLKVLTDLEFDAMAKQTDKDKKTEAEAREKEYRSWQLAQASLDNLDRRSIYVHGETLTIDPQETDIRQVRVLKNGELFIDVPVSERQVLTARALLQGDDVKNSPVSIILPEGDYELEVISADRGAMALGGRGTPVKGTSAVDSSALAAASGIPALDTSGAAGAAQAGKAAGAPAETAKVSQYRKPLKIGEDYVTFVAMGDGKVGYNINRGNIEPVQQVDQYQPGFYQQGKMAYYLKGKIKGKYIITSSFDSQRAQKEMFRSIKEDQYYPVYGDASQINYDATNTQGNLYLMLEWDKSQAIWGNYAVDLKDTEFAQYSRTLYGGKVDYASVGTNPYGDAKTHVVTFHADIRQRSAHNEFLGTGGSLYYLKNQGIVVGSAKVHLEVRDSVTGQVMSTTSMKDSVDYDIDNSQGRILFWQPVAMSADSGKIISNQLLSGNPVYVVVDYEYQVNEQILEGTQGVRVAQAVGNNVVVGGTYVTETQAAGKYELKGQDVTVHVGKDTTVKAEVAATTAQDSGSFVSTDGGITFSQLMVGNLANGKAYGIRQDSRLFDRLGLNSYFKSIDNSFATAASSSQEGKQLSGLGMTFDLTPVTRLTANYDVQKLIEQGNLQTAMQVGAQQTSTTVFQLVHDARRLRITGEFRHQEVINKNPLYVSESNQVQNTAALQAEYALDEKTSVKAKYQVDPSGIVTKAGEATTGITRRLTDRLSATIEESFGSSGMATKISATSNITPKIAVTTGYQLAKASDGTTSQIRTAALTGKQNIGNKTNIETTYSMTQADNGPARNAIGVGLGSQVNIDDAVLKAGVKVQADDKKLSVSQGGGLDVSKTDKQGHTTTSSVNVAEATDTGKTTTVTLGDKGNLSPGRDLVVERTMAFGQTGQNKGDTYKVVEDKDGKKLETGYTRKLADSQREHSASNIFGLSGDVNDRVAANLSLEQGRVQNVDGSIYNRTALAGGFGYVEKDEEGKEKVKSSTKLEGRIDRGSQDKQQVVVYQDIQGRATDELTLSGKFQYSQTKNRALNKVEAQYKEVMLGMAFRPVDNDRLNLFGKYTYKENQGPSGQLNVSDIEQTKMQVLSAEGAYDLTDDWQIVEKMAFRIMEEKVAGFDFATTHTWLLVNRANYRLNQDWKIGAEYRTLAVQEAKDRKSGFLLEAVHSLNDNVELGVGYNFTDFVDDLTNLGYTVAGPYVRMTGKLYDRTPEERARARQKWLDRRIEKYAWKMVNDEFTRKDSAVVLELNQMYQMAQVANDLGRYEESRQIYKDVLLATQMMFEEAANFVRKHISFEEKLYNAFQRAREYYDKGELWQAKKLWEKIVEEAERSMLQ